MNQPTFYSISRSVFVGYPDQPYLPCACDPAKLGVLNQFIGPTKKYNLEEINGIISQLLKYNPYLPGAAYIEVTVMWEDGKRTHPLHNLRFLNPECMEQEPSQFGIRYKV